jgi:hypothetical protein
MLLMKRERSATASSNGIQGIFFEWKYFLIKVTEEVFPWFEPSDKDGQKVFLILKVETGFF